MSNPTQAVTQKLKATKHSHRWLAVFAALLIAAPLTVPRTGSAYAPCTATISPDTFSPGHQINLNFSISNGSGGAFTWMQIVRPSDDYTINGSSINGWSDATSSSSSTITGNSLADGDSYDFQLGAQTGLVNTSMSAWLIKASPNADGSNAITCTGDHSTRIQGNLEDSGTVNFSNVAVSQITPTSATISWDTDNYTSSVIYYGTGLPYSRNTTPDYSLDLTHRQTISGLTPDTTYHFQLGGADQNASTVASSDNTFVTLPSLTGGNNGGSSGGASGGRTLTPGGSIIVSATDKIPPAVDIATKIQGTYKTPPAINGTASDNEGIAKVEYSTDGGKNWIAVDTLQTAGQKKTTYRFTPIITQEGNYQLAVRATDVGGNITMTTLHTLVIDILPPVVGTSSLSVGSQTVQPDDNGNFVALVGVDQTMTVSAVGGATSITISATQASNNSKHKEPAHNFSLSYLTEANLWRGAMSFQQAGTYQLVANAIDGAGNTTSRTLSSVTVIPAASLTGKNNKPLSQAIVTVYERDRDTEAWVEWNGEAYGQHNPSVSHTGGYGYYLPAGTYYLQARAPGYQPAITSSFTVTKPSIIATSIHLRSQPGITVNQHRLSLPLPNFGLTHVSPSATTTAAQSDSLLGTSLPKFSLPTTAGTTVTPASFFKKPLVLSVVSTWAPQAQDQIAILNTMPNDKVNFTALAMGEDVARLTAYTRVAGYNLPIVADKDNQLAPVLQPRSLPTHYFFNRRGVVKKVMVGVLSKEELIKNVQE